VTAGSKSTHREQPPEVGSQLELSVVECVSWFNHERLRRSLGGIPAVEFQDLYTFDGRLN
jgi:hypothetical protein